MTRAQKLWQKVNRSKLRAASRRHYKRNRTAILKRNKKWREDNSAYLKKYRKKNAKRVADIGRKHEYGLTPAEFRNLRRKQKNRCAVCRKRFRKTPHVDHCHKTKKIRGLVDRGCNSVLGFAGDSIRVLRNAIQYLKDYKQ